MLVTWGDEVLHYTDEGHGDAVLFVHGLGGNAHNWLHQRRSLAGHRRVITLDLPGHGRSSGRGVRFERYAEAAQAVLDAAGVERTAVVGLALGARVAISVAARLPGRVDRLSLVNAYLALPPDEHRRRVELYGLLLQPGGPVEWARQLLQGMGVADRRGIVRGFMASLDQIDPRHINAVFHQADRIDREKDELRGLDIPVQIMRGERDRLVPEECTARLVELARDPRLHRFPDSGHLPYLEQPASFDAALEAFLDR